MRENGFLLKTYCKIQIDILKEIYASTQSIDLYSKSFTFVSLILLQIAYNSWAFAV